MIKRNLLDLRQSERVEIGRKLTTADAFNELASSIEQTLLRFPRVTGPTEEQIYLFGADMRQLLSERPNKSLNVPTFRSHIDEEVQVVFGGGFVGLTLDETIATLREKRDAKRLVNLETKSRQVASGDIRTVSAAEASLNPSS